MKGVWSPRKSVYGKSPMFSLSGFAEHLLWDLERYRLNLIRFRHPRKPHKCYTERSQVNVDVYISFNTNWPCDLQTLPQGHGDERLRGAAVRSSGGQGSGRVVPRLQLLHLV